MVWKTLLPTLAAFMYVCAGGSRKKYRLEMPKHDATFVGTGDLFTAVLLARLHSKNDLKVCWSEVSVNSFWRVVRQPPATCDRRCLCHRTLCSRVCWLVAGGCVWIWSRRVVLFRRAVSSEIKHGTVYIVAGV